MRAFKYMHWGRLSKTACIITAVFTCNLFFTTGKKVGSTDDIKKSQHKALDFLKIIQRSDGAICDTVNHLFETWETILAVSAIYKSNPDINAPSVKKGLAFLRNNENSEGLICHNQKCKKAYCLETTAVYFNLLKLTGKYENIKKGLKKISALQKQTGEWDIGNPDVTIQKDFASVTAFVLNLLQGTSIVPVYKKESINWLLKKQTAEGDWGTGWEYYGCPAYALWPIMNVLKDENTNEARLAKDKAIAYILAAQNNDGSWWYKNPDLSKQTSAALQTALMLSALQNTGLQNGEVILKGIQFLVNNQQKNGNWDGGYFPIPEKRYSKQEYVFATALAADVMHHYLLNNKSK
jgi:hypothetical protein